MAGSRPGTLQALSRLILTTVLRSCHYSHYTDKETEAQSSHLVGKFNGGLTSSPVLKTSKLFRDKWNYVFPGKLRRLF